MEDLIPLIIVIAISIIGALTRKKKRQDQENISSPGQRLQRDEEIFKWFEKFEDEIISPVQSVISKNSPIKETPSEIKVTEKEVTPNRFSQYGGFISPEEREQIMDKEGISVVKAKKEKESISNKNIELPDEAVENQRIDFDLRRAVVFSEILNRKYV